MCRGDATVTQICRPHGSCLVLCRLVCRLCSGDSVHGLQQAAGAGSSCGCAISCNRPHALLVQVCLLDTNAACFVVCTGKEVSKTKVESKSKNCSAPEESSRFIDILRGARDAAVDERNRDVRRERLTSAKDAAHRQFLCCSLLTPRPHLFFTFSVGSSLRKPVPIPTIFLQEQLPVFLCCPRIAMNLASWACQA